MLEAAQVKALIFVAAVFTITWCIATWVDKRSRKRK